MNILLTVIAGLFSGIAGSMGLGGGFILLICLSLFTATPQLEAQLTNLIFFIPVAVLSVIIHRKNKLLETSAIKKSVFPGALGVIIGSITASFINSDLLSKLFGALVLIVGVKELFHKEENLENR